MAHITLYALSTCPWCRKARELLAEAGADFEVVEVDLLQGEPRAEAIAEVKRISGGTSFPVAVASGAVVTGFDPGGLTRLAGS
jgi:glutaredoxin